MEKVRQISYFYDFCYYHCLTAIIIYVVLIEVSSSFSTCLTWFTLYLGSFKVLEIAVSLDL